MDPRRRGWLAGRAAEYADWRREMGLDAVGLTHVHRAIDDVLELLDHLGGSDSRDVPEPESELTAGEATGLTELLEDALPLNRGIGMELIAWIMRRELLTTAYLLARDDSEGDRSSRPPTTLTRFLAWCACDGPVNIRDLDAPLLAGYGAHLERAGISLASRYLEAAARFIARAASVLPEFAGVRRATDDLWTALGHDRGPQRRASNPHAETYDLLRARRDEYVIRQLARNQVNPSTITAQDIWRLWADAVQWVADEPGQAQGRKRRQVAISQGATTPQLDGPTVKMIVDIGADIYRVSVPLGHQVALEPIREASVPAAARTIISVLVESQSEVLPGGATASALSLLAEVGAAPDRPILSLAEIEQTLRLPSIGFVRLDEMLKLWTNPAPKADARAVTIGRCLSDRGIALVRALRLVALQPSEPSSSPLGVANPGRPDVPGLGDLILNKVLPVLETTAQRDLTRTILLTLEAAPAPLAEDELAASVSRKSEACRYHLHKLRVKGVLVTVPTTSPSSGRSVQGWTLSYGLAEAMAAMRRLGSWRVVSVMADAAAWAGLEQMERGEATQFAIETRTTLASAGVIQPGSKGDTLTEMGREFIGAVRVAAEARDAHLARMAVTDLAGRLSVPGVIETLATIRGAGDQGQGVRLDRLGAFAPGNLPTAEALSGPVGMLVTIAQGHCRLASTRVAALVDALFEFVPERAVIGEALGPPDLLPMIRAAGSPARGVE